ncbi:MAG: hypothetical protein EPO30_10895 [Lysobacteraceae bacterium]|nr:MAG: hypothetical protein EPO30_10895 [Xanthomonadaceae bacterium]
MTADGLSLHSSGNPHQALFLFDANSEATRLVLDADGEPVGWDYDEQGQVILDEERTISLPPDVANAAREWFEGRSRGHSANS